MRVSIFALALFACNSIAADYNTVLSGIYSIGNKTVTLDKDIKTVTGGFNGLKSALQVQSDTVAVDEQLQQSIADANASPKFGSQGSIAISNALINLQKTVNTSLTDLQAKRTELDVFRPIVLAALYQLKQDQDAFGAAVIKKLDDAEAKAAPAVIKQYDGFFNSAILKFGGKSKS